MPDRIVKCIKLGEELPGLKSPPIPNELGKKIYENVSQKAWNEFLEYFKMVINEYRLDLTSPMADQIFEQKIEEYFFSDNLKMPEGYVPPEEKLNLE
jgi:Fe-S cluster biosynthesis and repair protein YggX